jgi:hypothetical protein
MQEKSYDKYVRVIVEHPDRDEIISKLSIGIEPVEIAIWLKEKYGDIGERKFTLSEDIIYKFSKEYLDIYNNLKEDVANVRGSSNLSNTENLQLSIENNKSYRKRIEELAGKEVDIKRMVAGAVVALEQRVEQIYDLIQEDPRNMKMDRALIDYFNTLSMMMEKCNKIVNEAPDQVIQHNVTVQVLDQHIGVFIDALRETLSEFDYETSLKIMDRFNDKLTKLKAPSSQVIPTDTRLAEAKILSENILKDSKTQ